jgi:hypothetical protein
MADPTRPIAWANTLAKAWGPNFPVDVRKIALEYTRTKFKEQPIEEIVTADVGSTFEGCLYFAPTKKKWFILYNPDISPSRRVNFTLGHELGHYLIHRELSSRFECSQRNMVGFNNGERDIEGEANTFASYLLMPLNDFRAQIGTEKISLALLDHCANRYDVSLTAATLKWLEYTTERAVLVVSRDDFILWSRASRSAFKSGVFFRKGTPVPAKSLAYLPSSDNIPRPDEFNIPPGVWRQHEPVQESLITSDRYDLNISLLVLPRISRVNFFGEESEHDLADDIQSQFRD